MSNQQKKRKELTIDSFFPGNSQDMEPDQELPTNFKQVLEDLKTQLTHELKIQLIQELKKQSRESEDNLKKEIHELKQENKVLKTKIDQLENEGKKVKDQKEKDDQKAKDEIQSLKTRIEQQEANDFTRQQEYIQQNRKHEKFEENMKELLQKTTQLEKRNRRNNLRIIGLPEHHDKRKSLDIILHEIYKNMALTFSNKKEKWRLKESRDHLLHLIQN